MSERGGWWDATLDLVTGSACVGCDRPGRLLCGRCEAALPERSVAARPDPAPPGLPPVRAGAPYAGLVRTLVLGHKEQARHALAGPLAGLLAQACAGLLAECAGPSSGPSGGPSGGGVLHLVPVPSRPGVTRARGHDPTRTLARGAARALGRAGLPVACTPLLRHRGGAVDQAGLDAAARAANQAGTLALDPAALRRARRGGAVVPVVCDDVVTTGATLAEAARALAAGGAPPLGAATVAATPRRRPVSGGVVHPWNPRLSSGAETH